MTDRAAVRCAACGGGVAPGAVRCSYCGVQLARAACPSCLALVPVDARHCPACGRPAADPEPAAGPALACPSCGGALGAVRSGGVPLRPCSACGGIWLGREDFETLARDREARDLYLGEPHGAALPAPHLDPVRYRPCPVCARLMNRSNYARISGVILDACRDHGFWFDRDELRRVVEFIGDGGLDRAARRERETRPREPVAPVEPATPGGTGALGALEDQAGGLLLDAALRMFHLLP